jgi:hypothetical protein
MGTESLAPPIKVLKASGERQAPEACGEHHAVALSILSLDILLRPVSSRVTPRFTSDIIPFAESSLKSTTSRCAESTAPVALDRSRGGVCCRAWPLRDKVRR